MNRIYISTDLNDTTAMDNYFAQHDASAYDGSLEEATAEMEHWIDQGWATAEPTDENTEEVTPAQMQALIQEHVIRE